MYKKLIKLKNFSLPDKIEEVLFNFIQKKKKVKKVLSTRYNKKL